MTDFKLKISGPSGIIYDGLCSSLIVPTSDGYRGIMANHENAAVAVSDGTISLTEKNERKTLPVTGAILMFENNEANIILHSSAEFNN
ncbi:MAG: hypothetical protein IJJ61_01490 [Clostridia bacterium]|nr:hypothetical protein [Clostridia bacterium]